MVLAVPSFALANLVNTALVNYIDSQGNFVQGMSNTVTIVVNGTSPPLLATPVLNLPPFVPINGQIRVVYSGNEPADYFSWSFTPVAVIPSIAANRPDRSAMESPSASLKTPGPQANLGSVLLGLGPYLVKVVAYDKNNNPSQPAQAYTTLVPADLASVRVYPNPWRHDRDAGKSVTFDGLTINSRIRIFTVSGHEVKTFPARSTSVTWDLTNDSGDHVASGVYLYLITTDQGQKKTGQLVIIK